MWYYISEETVKLCGCRGIMTRLGWLALVLLLLVQVRGMAAADLIQKIAANDPARAQLRLLDKVGLLPSSHATLFELPMTRYDVAFAMIEPLRSFIALTETPNANSSPEDRRLHTQVAQLLSTLSREDLLRLLTATEGLLNGYADLIEKLAPELPTKAGIALRQMRETTLKGVNTAKNDPHLIVRVSVDPNAVPDAMGNPLPLLPIHPSDIDPRPLPFSGGVSDSVRVLPANTMEASVNVIFNRLQLTTKIAKTPGSDWNVIRPDQLSGSAMFRLQYLIGQINDNLSIGGIVEYHILRSSEESGISSTKTGSVAGVIILW